MRSILLFRFPLSLIALVCCVLSLSSNVENARAWLKFEPNFNPSDDSYHNGKSDDKLPGPGRKNYHALQMRQI
jgi:hypothetical protein